MTINAREIDKTISMLRELPGAPEVPTFRQEVLDETLKVIAGHG